jgi:hypothetical protein
MARMERSSPCAGSVPEWTSRDEDVAGVPTTPVFRPNEVKEQR